VTLELLARDQSVGDAERRADRGVAGPSASITTHRARRATTLGVEVARSNCSRSVRSTGVSTSGIVEVNMAPPNSKSDAINISDVFH
jgi:hypothetical protein